MSKLTASADGEAMPTEGHKTRRAILRLFRAAPALAILPAVAAAADTDAELLELIAQWRETNARARAAAQRVSELDVDVPVPDVLIKTRDDAEWFRSDEDVGDHYFRPASILKMKRTVQVFVGHFINLYPLEAMLERFQEIDAAHSAYRSAVERAKEAVGYFELERQEEEACAEERRLCREVAVMQARTVPGLLAKLSAVADIYTLEDLEADTSFDLAAGKIVPLERAALTVLRDCARMSAVGCDWRA